ncbi:extracellular solute-binding protein [Variovorax paradoxus]|mgnify:CR=1 FL=1|uniref:extracellular solute-binding protein n=1 Tax=Variovorax paradoxus TaxID=34073 RepID=UPI0003A56F6C|nr:extracellular solute-binding protein [Variovorax paradoxus]
MHLKKACCTLGLAAIATIGSASAQQAPDLKGQRITLAEFGGSLGPTVKQALLDPFEKATGAKVNRDSPNPKAKLKAMVEAKNVVWDVYTEDAAYITQHCGTLFEKVDTSAFIAAGIDKRFVNNECGVPGVVVGFVFAYNEGKVRASPPKSWADFFDLKKFPGKRAIHNNVVNGALEMALLADGVPAEKLYPLDLDRAFRKLDTIKSSILWTQSSGGLTDALVNNQVDYALSYSGRVYAAAKAGAKVALVKDQQILSWDQYAVVKGTKNKAAAEALLRSIAQPEPQRHLSELTSYAMANSTSPPQLDALSARFLPSRENAVFQDMAWWAKNYDQINQRFVTWQSQ